MSFPIESRKSSSGVHLSSNRALAWSRISAVGSLGLGASGVGSGTSSGTGVVEVSGSDSVEGNGTAAGGGGGGEGVYETASQFSVR